MIDELRGWKMLRFRRLENYLVKQSQTNGRIFIDNSSDRTARDSCHNFQNGYTCRDIYIPTQKDVICQKKSHLKWKFSFQI